MAYSFDEFKKFVFKKKVAIVGAGVSNTPLIQMMLDLGADVVVCDKKTSLGEYEEELEKKNVKLYLGENYLEGTKEADIIFRTPSLMPTNPYIKEALDRGAYVTSEMGEFLKYCKGKVIGITGSDGKTTTTTLVYEMLKKQGYNVFLGGNIGNPLFHRIEEIKENDFVVLELSSFQLIDAKFSPKVSIITNITPNHLDIHKDMQEYIESKKNIFLHQEEGGVVVLNKDNEITRKIAEETDKNVRLFSRKEKAFSYLEEDNLIIDNNIVCHIDEVKLPGMHNIENLLAAFAAVYDFVSIDTMRYVAMNFSGVEHRIEFVREVNGIKFYNDSIASSPARTLAGLKSFKQKVILIAGGYDKNIPFEPLAEEGIDYIKCLVLLGKTKDKIKNAFLKVMEERNIEIPIVIADSLEDAVLKAYNAAEKGDIITLSPACASFDMFKNFEERGRIFKEIVNKI
ncbi:UDP-N-acetylmuramoyl-L-alanine--D-glutamate ligase [Caloramator proteoclasticus]|uniref:UDP-N-acetylmuramoylalanine--D-glutamate ligase n=1 Tax=Caloramator proteoclasticus DSM 10124 TaxID=1121262 RepID=A0A1M5BUL5_9CLOT|nr:UDP-N-acetylmuramoyl-L-alanine--D-glutamate ligase [Caloramator proteoclasticus]SHF46253.1 UDP-N-acetylmuramoylalanine--D-glutamate ligase [Caloramator proteoclasticus DSM 10124]